MTRQASTGARPGAARKAANGDRPHVLYRFYDADDSLLYVGKTADPGARWKAHSKEKPWWSQVTRVSVDHFTNAADVELAEVSAIVNEHPRYNITHNVRPEEDGIVPYLVMSAEQVRRKLAHGKRTLRDQLADALLELERGHWGELNSELEAYEDAGDHRPTNWLRQQILAHIDEATERETVGACPACGREAYLIAALDRFVHADGSPNDACWLACLRGEAGGPAGAR